MPYLGNDCQKHTARVWSHFHVFRMGKWGGMRTDAALYDIADFGVVEKISGRKYITMLFWQKIL